MDTARYSSELLAPLKSLDDALRMLRREIQRGKQLLRDTEAYLEHLSREAHLKSSADEL